MLKQLSKTFLVLFCFNLAGCEATRLPDFEAPTLNISTSQHNKEAKVSSKSWTPFLNLPKSNNFLATYNPSGALDTPIVVMVDDKLEDSSFIFKAKTNGKEPTDATYKTYGLQKFQLDASKNLTGVLMGDKPQNSTDFYSLTNNKLLKITTPADAKKGDLADVGAKYGKTPFIFDIEAPVAFVSKGAEAEFIWRDPLVIDWNYQTFGYFKQNIDGGTNKHLGFQSVGIKTQKSQIPQSGLAQYKGVMNGFFSDKSTNKKYMLYGNIQVWVSFDENRALFNVDKSFNSTEVVIYEILSTGALGQVYPNLKKTAISLTERKCTYEPFATSQFYFFATDKNTASLNRQTASIEYNFLQNLATNEIVDADCKNKIIANKHLKNGRIKAQLYGDKAAEIGGVFELHSKEQNIVFMGAFGAKRN